MKKRIFTIILFVVSAFITNAQSLNDISFGTDSTFEAVTWNIEWFPKNGNQTADSVSKIITALNADLIGLQEIDDTTMFRQVINNIPNYELQYGSGRFGGLAFVYNTNTVQVHSIYKIYDSSPYWNALPRSPLVIEFTYNGDSLIVINNHFKCCGDGTLETGNTSDQEYRRYIASKLIKQHIDANHANQKVIVLGDLNDVLTDAPENNVFQRFLNDSLNYAFADMSIAQTNNGDWSYPTWPSHIDHILITNELFPYLNELGSEIKTIKVDQFYTNGWNGYDNNVSDHRPVGIKLNMNANTVSVNDRKRLQYNVYPNPSNGNFTIQLENVNSNTSVRIVNIQGQLVYNSTLSKSASKQIDLQLTAGIYLIQVKSSASAQTTKLVIK